MEFVDAHDGIGIAIGEFVTRDEILGFLHHHTHLLQVIGGDAIESSGIDDEHSRLHSDAWHTQNPLVVVTIDVHGKLFWMPQCPRQLRVNFQIEVGICFIHNLLHLKLIEPHEPISLIESVLTHQRRLFQDRQTGVVGVHAYITRIIDTSHGGLPIHG